MLAAVVYFLEEPTGFSPTFASLLMLSISSILLYYMLINLERGYIYKKKKYFASFPMQVKDFINEEFRHIITRVDFIVLNIVNFVLLYIGGFPDVEISILLILFILYIFNNVTLIFFCIFLKILSDTNSHQQYFFMLVGILILMEIFNIEAVNNLTPALFYVPFTTLFFSYFLAGQNILLSLTTSFIFISALYSLYRFKTQY